MKCPKCGYLGFDRGDRCRNCGYEFSLVADMHSAAGLAAGGIDPLDVTLDSEQDRNRPPLDLDRLIGVPDAAPASDLPLFGPSTQTLAHGAPAADAAPEPKRPLEFIGPRAASREVDDVPLITTPSRPRAPLGVRRATPEIPRARAPRPKPPQSDTLFEMPHGAPQGRATDAKAPAASPDRPLAGPVSRVLAALVDAALLIALDAAVLYFTLRLVDAELRDLPVLPLAAFILLLNGGYFIAFTTVGGQSIGKMAFGLKVIAQDDTPVPIGRATLRTFAYLLSALPLGAGFLAGVFGADRLALHDRLAHTRVIRPS